MKRIMLKLLAGMLAAGAATAAYADDPLFASSEPIHIVIQAPLSNLMRNRDSDSAVAGTLTDPAGQALPISLKIRGITRRLAETCDFAPLRVDLAGRPPATSVFAGQGHLKLVTHCRNAPAFQQYVLLEYAAYRMYNVLTPRSFRVRLANIDYREADGRPMLSRVGFFIEDAGDVARRNGMAEVHAGERIPVADLSAPDAARYALFQHMIANHDWSMRAGPAGDDCCHNARLIGAAAPGMAIPVPYDFDFSGFVSAPYATPPDILHISDVRQRYYRGYCAHNTQVLAAAREMHAARPQMLAEIARTPGLDPRTQARATAFLDRFFADTDSDQSTIAKVLGRCLG